MVVDNYFFLRRKIPLERWPEREIDSQFDALKLYTNTHEEYSLESLSSGILAFSSEPSLSPWRLWSMVDRRRVQEKKKETRTPPTLPSPHPPPTLPLPFPPGERGEGEGGGEKTRRSREAMLGCGAAAARGPCGISEQCRPVFSRVGATSPAPGNRATVSFPSIPILRPAVFLESVPFLTCRARPADTISLARPNEMCIGGRYHHTLGQSLLKTLRFFLLFQDPKSELPR